VASRVQAGRVIPPLEPGTRRPPVDPIAPRESRAPTRFSQCFARLHLGRDGRQAGQCPAPRGPPGLGTPKSPAGAGTFFGLAASEFPGNRHFLRQRGYRRMRALSPSTDIGDRPGCMRLERALLRRFRALIPPAFRPRTGALRPRRAAPIARHAGGGPACGIRESAVVPEPGGWAVELRQSLVVVFGHEGTSGLRRLERERAPPSIRPSRVMIRRSARQRSPRPLLKPVLPPAPLAARRAEAVR
jgi:hypothetical protein